jgi:hypothetical protein
LVLLSVLQLWIGAAPAAPSGTGHAAHEHSLADGILVRPRHGVDRHCGGACLRSGEPSWYRFAKRSCILGCATAAALVTCAIPRRCRIVARSCVYEPTWVLKFG